MSRLGSLVLLSALVALTGTVQATASGTAYATSSNCLFGGGLLSPNPIATCTIQTEYTVDVTSCDANGCFYDVSGWADFLTSFAGYLNIQANVNDFPGPNLNGCHQATTTQASYVFCSVTDTGRYVTVAPGDCHYLLLVAGAQARATPTSVTLWTSHAFTQHPLWVCRDAAGAPSVVV